MQETMRRLLIDIIYGESRKSGMAIIFIVDDTISSKTIPSSKASHPIEAASFHFSHSKRKQDYGHQAVSVMLSCNGITLNYAIVMYDKSASKIDIVKQLAENLPSAPNPSYLLCDSWCACGKLIDAFATKGFYTVGALKSNRNMLHSLKKFVLKGFLLFLTLPSMVGRSLPFWLWSLNSLLCILTNALLLCSFIV